MLRWRDRGAEDAQWLCFLDADMRVTPRAIASAVETASDRKLDLLTLAPRHDLESFAERLMLPCGLYLLGFYQNLEKVQATDSDAVVATGQFMLIRREAYDAVGGHAPVRDAICEDVELALLMKRRGYRVLLMDGNLLLRTRMYTGWSTLWPGFAKNLIQLLGGPYARCWLRQSSQRSPGSRCGSRSRISPRCSRVSAARRSHSLWGRSAPAALVGLHVGGAVHFKIHGGMDSSFRSATAWGPSWPSTVSAGV